MRRNVERFKARTRWLHWIIVLSAFGLLVTGMFLYVPWWGAVAQDGWTRLFHRILAVFFIAAPVLYFFLAPGRVVAFVKATLTWGRDDFEWMREAPDYYFGGDESKMPPQPEMNTGQKLFALVALLSAVALVITGAVLWFAKGHASPGIIQGALFVHDLALIVGGSMTLLHFYLGAVHPRMSESFKSMITGKVSVEYAKSHYGKWYDEVAAKGGVKENPGDEAEEEGQG